MRALLCILAMLCASTAHAAPKTVQGEIIATHYPDGSYIAFGLDGAGVIEARMLQDDDCEYFAERTRITVRKGERGYYTLTLAVDANVTCNVRTLASLEAR